LHDIFLNRKLLLLFVKVRCEILHAGTTTESCRYSCLIDLLPEFGTRLFLSREYSRFAFMQKRVRT